jgi:hypothetical protein
MSAVMDFLGLGLKLWRRVRAGGCAADLGVFDRWQAKPFTSKNAPLSIGQFALVANQIATTIHGRPFLFPHRIALPSAMIAPSAVTEVHP